jgi:hypothetical protein
MFSEKSAGRRQPSSRARRGYREKFLAAMNKVRDIPPQASDELPE